MKKSIVIATLILFTASPALGKRFYFPGEKTESQKKQEARERYEERYQKKLDYLYLKDQESLVDYKRKKRNLKLEKLERSLENDTHFPELGPAEGPYLKK